MPETPKDDVTQEAEQMRKAPPLLPTEAYHCMECGFGVRVDEDECCTTCGFDCELRPMPEWITAAVTSLEARAESAEARLAQVEEFARHKPECHYHAYAHEPGMLRNPSVCTCGLASLLSSPAPTGGRGQA